MPPIVLSFIQADDLLSAFEAGLEQVVTSLDLGLSSREIEFDLEGVNMPDGQTLNWEQIHEIRGNELACYQVEKDAVTKISVFSESFNRYYSLMPTKSAPTMLISGIPMHRIKNTNPHKDTLSKIKALGSTRGQILDTTMGLGYTAVQAAKTADQVTVCELDPAVLEICHANPWSQGLFENPKINILIGDVFERIRSFSDGQFAGIIHDPPMFTLAGELYSAEFYRELLRVLRKSGKLFHYIGDPDSRSGRNTTRGVKKRLLDVGFRRVRPAPRAFGVVALK